MGPISRDRLADKQIAIPPQGLRSLPLTIAMYVEDPTLSMLVQHIVDDVHTLESITPDSLPQDVLQDLDGILVLVKPGFTMSGISAFQSYCQALEVPLAAYCVDEMLTSFSPLTGLTTKAPIPPGVLPHLDNPCSDSPKSPGTAIFNRSNRKLRDYRLALGGLNPPFMESNSLSPLHAKRASNQLIIDPDWSATAANSTIMLKHLAVGTPLRVTYSPFILNNFPGVECFVEGFKRYGKHAFSEEWDQFRASSLVAQVYTSGTVYDAFASVLAELTSHTSSTRIWKSRILLVCDHVTSEIAQVLEFQPSFSVHIISTVEASKLEINQLVAQFDYIARMSDAYLYPPDYLVSKLSAFRYSAACFVTEPQLAKEQLYSSVSEAVDPDCTVSTVEVEGCLEFFTLNQSAIAGPGIFDSGYSARLSHRLEHHFAPGCAADTGIYSLSVIIPVFNNGEFLLSKALPSLLRNDCWRSMEVILVDDGSTDHSTISICTFLSSLFPNVRTFSFPPGGSGSASRARNKGIELSTCLAITFLDPDNEISTGGYDKLLSRFNAANSKGKHCDFLSGYQVKVSSQITINARHSYSSWPTMIRNPREEFFESGRFPTVSTQAAVIHKQLLHNHDISFIEGAVGQDTLFGWEVLLAARNPMFTNEAHLLYFSERDSSVTNNVNAAYFEKSIIRERAQVRWLKRNKLFEIYVDKKYDYFYNRWYKEKLKQVKYADYADAETLLEQICQLYGRPFV